MVEGQGGSVSVISKIDQGSRFSFRLDFKKAEEKTKIEAAENEETENRNKRRKCFGSGRYAAESVPDENINE